jgi:succinate-acetate transporter protein
MSQTTSLSGVSTNASASGSASLTRPVGVHIGSGSDPRVLGLMAFALGTLILGMVAIGQFPASVLGGVVPVAFFCSGLALAAASVWAFILGSSFLAGTFGIVAGFFSSYSILLMGLAHNWFAVPASSVSSLDEVFFIVWCCFFLAVLIPSLHLPVIYPLINALLVTYLALEATSTYTGMGPGNVTMAAGASILAASFFLFWGYLASSLTVVRARVHIPEGPALLAVKPAEDVHLSDPRGV